jgi:DNA repair exonuclease SbcCD ATPase subunit
MEVDETTVLEIGYEAEDDFGLQDAALVYQGSDGVEHRLPLHQGRFDQRRVTEQSSWDFYQYPLPGGDTVQVYIEVYDNDTISGPKKGVSETLTLKVRNREEEHQALEDLQRDITDALLDLLADHLELADDFETWREQEMPKPDDLVRAQAKQQEAAERAAQLSEQLEEALAKVQNDPYSTYETFADLQALQRNLDYLQQQLMPQLEQSMQPMQTSPSSAEQQDQADKALEKVVQELERLSSLAEDIANAEKFHDLMQLSTKMMEQQNQLLAALDNVPKDFQGGDMPPELQKLLDSIDQMMQELAQAVSQMPQTMSDEFLNQQLQNLPLSNMQEQLDAIRQKLAEGDIEGAKKLAEEMLKTLSTMVAAMQNMEQQARGGPIDAMSQQLQESVDTLSDLVQRQEEIVNQTQNLDQAALQQLNRAQQEAFEAMQRDLERKLAELSRQLADLSQRARQHPELDTDFQRAYRDVQNKLGELRQHLQQHDMPQSQEALSGAQRQMDWMQQHLEQLQSPDQQLEQQATQAQERLSALQQRMNGLPNDRQAMLSPEQRSQLGQLGQQQEAVGNETAQLQQAFDNLLPLMPFLPSETVDNLQQAIPLMQQAQGELNTHQSQQAIPPEQGALERLRNAQNSLQQAMQQLSQRGQMMGQSMPMLRQAGRLPMPGQRPQVDQQQNGIAGASVRNFQLPDKEAYKVPRMFREDIMEALKEGYPERYKELIEQYYRNIVR